MLDALEAATALSEKRRALAKTLLDAMVQLKERRCSKNGGAVELGKSRTAQNDSDQSEAP